MSVKNIDRKREGKSVGVHEWEALERGALVVALNMQCADVQMRRCKAGRMNERRACGWVVMGSHGQ